MKKITSLNQRFVISNVYTVFHHLSCSYTTICDYFCWYQKQDEVNASRENETRLVAIS